MTFLAGERLWLLVAVAALAAVYVSFQLRRRTTYTVRFTNLALLDVVAPERPAWRRHVPAGALLLGIAALVVALAEPAHDARVPRERATVVLAIDVSLSMEATDVEPNRLTAAKEAANEFLDGVPATINVGLVSFARSASLLVSPTTDHDEVRRAVTALQLDVGTAVGEAILVSLGALDSLPEPEDPDEAVPATIILISDGTTTVGRPNEQAVEEAAARGVPVSTIAFGTDRGLISIEGNPTPVPPDLDAMAAIADGTGGVFFEAATGAALEAAYADLGSSIGFDTEQRVIAEWFVGAALGLLLAAGALSLLWFARLP